MNAAVSPPISQPAEHKPEAALRTLVLCDLVDSTALVERLGDQRALEIFRKHDRLGRALLQRHGGHEIDKTDGFLLLFDRPSQAVAFALEYQRCLRELSQEENQTLRARIGIHVGELLVYENSPEDIAQGAKPVEVEGLIKPMAARLMGLALPGQVLLSGMAFGITQRAEMELKREFKQLRWKFHGRYCFKGLPDSMPVYEVGEADTAPFARPPSNDKAWRHRPGWLRPKVLFAEVLLVAIIGAIGLYLSMRTQPAIAFAERDWVVVGDLRNLTSQPVFDASLETAFRVSLEQSRFVNVVSDLSVRDALKRMAREGGTLVDRQVGSEIALREGARALIVPTVAEVGGRVRVSAEIIDPHTETTVYAESADGVGAESTLASIDHVTRELRGKLGEAIKSIENDSTPLPKVTTANLDALRAYALGTRALHQSAFSDAVALLEQALALDPDFALARLGLVRVYLSSDDRARALHHLTLAAPLRSRLTPREALYLDAFLATYGKPREMLEKWKLLTAVYPDFFAGYYNYALFAWERTNRFTDAIAAAQGADTPHNPTRVNVLIALALFNLGEERTAKSFEYLHEAAKLSGGRVGWVEVSVLATAGRLQDAKKALGQIRRSGVASNDLGDQPTAIALEVDLGLWGEARARAAAALTEAQGVGSRFAHSFATLDLALLAYEGPQAKFETEAERLVGAGLTALSAPDHPNYEHALFETLITGYFAQRLGYEEIAKRVRIRALPAAKQADGYDLVQQAAALLEAEHFSSEGNPEQAIERLTPLVDGTELFLVHAALADANLRAKRWDGAEREIQWLGSHRGRAYAEFALYPVLRPVNVLETKLAPLRAAESLWASGDFAAAKGRLAEFEKDWPRTTWPTFVKRRAAAVSRPPRLS